MNAYRIDGRKIAAEILGHLTQEIIDEKLKPCLQVILVGDNAASLSYIRQKQKAGEKIGAVVNLIDLPASTTDIELQLLISTFNTDKNVHGIIIQRPLPNNSPITLQTLNSINPKKDIDGFLPKSAFEVPVACGVIAILEHIYHQIGHGTNFLLWLRQQEIAVFGKGETAGKPIIHSLEKLSVPVLIVDSKTVNNTSVAQKATIIISCVGKPKTILPSMINNRSILISVGLFQDDQKALHGDFEEGDVKDTVMAYTPTPGGVGPVNVACLMQNLVKACKRQKEDL